MKIGTKLKAVKDIYYVNPSNIHENWYTKESVIEMCSKMISEGDVYELVGYNDFVLEAWECIEGSMLGEFSDGYFEMSSMIEKGVFVEVDV
jgi:hypothetical protein